jgi:Na+/proline symporter
LFVIAVMIAGYVLMAKNASFPDRNFLIGWALFYGAFLAAAFLRVFGPRFTATATSPLDERELMVKARAHAISGVVLATFAMLGCFYMASGAVLGLWHPQLPMDWFNLGFGLQAAGMLLPTLIASWLQPPPLADDED